MIIFVPSGVCEIYFRDNSSNSIRCFNLLCNSLPKGNLTFPQILRETPFHLWKLLGVPWLPCPRWPRKGFVYRTTPGDRPEMDASLGCRGQEPGSTLGAPWVSAQSQQEGPLRVNIIVASGMQKSQRCSVCRFQVAEEQK